MHKSEPWLTHLIVPPLSDGRLDNGQVIETVIDANAVFVDDVKAGRDAAAMAFPVEQKMKTFS